MGSRRRFFRCRCVDQGPWLALLALRDQYTWRIVMSYGTYSIVLGVVAPDEAHQPGTSEAKFSKKSLAA